MIKSDFSDKEVAEMIEMYQQGHGLMYIAAQYYSNNTTIKQVLTQNGVTIRGRGGFEINASQRLIKRVVNLYQNGYTIDTIAKRVGYSGTTIRRWLMDNGVRIRSKNPETDKKAEQKVKQVKEVILGEPIDCDTQGKKCIYRNPDDKNGLCNYCLTVGKCRGGSPHECTKYKFPEKKKRVK